MEAQELGWRQKKATPANTHTDPAVRTGYLHPSLLPPPVFFQCASMEKPSGNPEGKDEPVHGC
jgi:hypothetical protein